MYSRMLFYLRCYFVISSCFSLQYKDSNKNGQSLGIFDSAVSSECGLFDILRSLNLNYCQSGYYCRDYGFLFPRICKFKLIGK